MEKSTKLIIAAVGLGGLGFFLYKKGLFSGKTTKVPDVVKPITDTGKKTGVEPPPIDTIKPKFTVLEETKKTPIWQQTEIYPVDVVNPQEGKLAVTPPTQTSFQPYLYDRLPVTEYGYNQSARLDYTTGKYNDGMPFDYIEKDLENIRLNKLLYA